MKQSVWATWLRISGAALLTCSAGAGCSATVGSDSQSSMDPASSGGSGQGQASSSAMRAGSSAASARGGGSGSGGSAGGSGNGSHGSASSGGSGGGQADGGGPTGTDGGASSGSASSGAAPDAGTSGGGPSLPPLPTGALDTKLPMPPRQEWDTDVGWCGEESVQTVGLHYGAWISQLVVRTVAGAPFVLGNGGEGLLTSLHFAFATWDYASANNPEYQDFMIWMKGYLARGIPTIFSEYVHDHNNPPDPDYDHLVPGIGIKTTSADSTTYDPNDVLYFNTNESTSLAIAFGSLPGDRTCAVDSYNGGCVPTQVDYGVAVTGIVDPDGATRPVEVSVGSDHEPNPTSGMTPKNMNASVLVSGLTAGQSYTLLRYNDYTKVPTSGAPASYQTSAFDAKVDFTATSSQWKYDDPAPFLSNTAVFYRCVPK